MSTLAQPALAGFPLTGPKERPMFAWGALSRHLLRSIILVAALILFVFVPGNSEGAAAQAPSGPASTELDISESDASHVVLELAVSGFDLSLIRTEAGVYSSITVPQLAESTTSGKPQLPMRGVMVAIPPGAQVTLRILGDETRRSLLEHPPVPGATQTVQIKSGETLPTGLESSFKPDPSVYAGSSVYPAQLARVVSTGTLRSQHYALVELYPFQYNPTSRELVWHATLRVEVDFRVPAGQSPQGLGTIDEGPFESILRSSLVNYEDGLNWRTRPSAPRIRAQSFAYAAGPWLRIPITDTGIYRVTCPELQAADPGATGLDPAKLQLFKNGAELVIPTVGGTWVSSCTAGDYIEFFGQALSSVAPPNGSPPNKYSKENIYWLTYGQANGKRTAMRDGSGAGTISPTFGNSLHIEKNLYYFSYVPLLDPAGPDANGYEHWFWAFPRDGGSANFPFQIDRLAPGVGTASLTYSVVGFQKGSHHTQVYVNSNLVDDVTFTGNILQKATVSFPQTFLTAGANAITITEGVGATLPDEVEVDQFDLSYNATYTASNNALAFSQASDGTTQFQVGGFGGNSSLRVYDVTDAANVAAFNPATLTLSGGPAPYSISFLESQASTHSYVALEGVPGTAHGTITKYVPANLSSGSNGADYILIAHNSLISASQPLASYRASQGLRVKVVDVQSIYDEFDDGVVDPQAIHDFLAFAYSSWASPKPSYVLLVGDGSFDPKEYCLAGSGCYSTTSPNQNLIPPFLRNVDPWVEETASDSRLVAFNVGNTLPSMSIGRLPVSTPAETTDVINKILAYEQNPPLTDWRKRISFVADTAFRADGSPDPAGNFWTASDSILTDPGLVPPSFTGTRVYYNACSPGAHPQCALPYPSYATSTDEKNAILSAVNNGSLIVSYVGHGSPLQWSNGTIFSTGDLPSLNNGAMTPVMVEMTCFTGRFHDPTYPSLGETNLRLPGNGAVAVWAATGEGVGPGHDLLERGFFGALFQQGIPQLGPATVAGKLNLFVNGGGNNLDLVDTYILLGDPASRLPATFPVDDSDSRVSYNRWLGQFDPNASGGAYRIGDAKNATAKFTFTGRSVTWITRKGPEEGRAQVLIDGVLRMNFDGYSPTPQYNVAMNFGGLTNVKHTITIKVAGVKTNAAASDFSAAVDAFIVGSTRTEESSTKVQYDNWKSVAQLTAFRGAYRASAQAGTTASLTFDGTSVTWLTTRGNKYGKASVMIDGVNKGTVDLYRPTMAWQYPLTYSGLAPGSHTITINVLGTRNAASSANTVIVDGFMFQ